MKKLIAGVLLTTCIATAAVAGGHHSKDHRGAGFMPIQKMVKVLDLTEAQQEQLKALKEEMRSEMKAKRGERSREDSIKAQLAQLDPSDANYEQDLNELANLQAEKAKARFLKMAEMRVKISQILTPEQLEKLDSIAKKRGERGKRGHKMQRDS